MQHINTLIISNTANEYNSLQNSYVTTVTSHSPDPTRLLQLETQMVDLAARHLPCVKHHSHPPYDILARELVKISGTQAGPHRSAVHQLALAFFHAQQRDRAEFIEGIRPLLASVNQIIKSPLPLREGQVDLDDPGCNVPDLFRRLERLMAEPWTCTSIKSGDKVWLIDQTTEINQILDLIRQFESPSPQVVRRAFAAQKQALSSGIQAQAKALILTGLQGYLRKTTETQFQLHVPYQDLRKRSVIDGIVQAWTSPLKEYPIYVLGFSSSTSVKLERSRLLTSYRWLLSQSEDTFSASSVMALWQRFPFVDFAQFASEPVSNAPLSFTQNRAGYPFQHPLTRALHSAMLANKQSLTWKGVTLAAETLTSLSELYLFLGPESAERLESLLPALADSDSGNAIECVFTQLFAHHDQTHPIHRLIEFQDDSGKPEALKLPEGHQWDPAHYKKTLIWLEGAFNLSSIKSTALSQRLVQTALIFPPSPTQLDADKRVSLIASLLKHNANSPSDTQVMREGSEDKLKVKASSQSPVALAILVLLVQAEIVDPSIELIEENGSVRIIDNFIQYMSFLEKDTQSREIMVVKRFHQSSSRVWSQFIDGFQSSALSIEESDTPMGHEYLTRLGVRLAIGNPLEVSCDNESITQAVRDRIIEAALESNLGATSEQVFAYIQSGTSLPLDEWLYGPFKIYLENPEQDLDLRGHLPGKRFWDQLEATCAYPVFTHLRLRDLPALSKKAIQKHLQTWKQETAELLYTPRDLTLPGGKTLKCHEALLRSTFDYFGNSTFSIMREGTADTLKLEEISYEAFASFYAIALCELRGTSLKKAMELFGLDATSSYQDIVNGYATEWLVIADRLQAPSLLNDDLPYWNGISTKFDRIEAAPATLCFVHQIAEDNAMARLSHRLKDTILKRISGETFAEWQELLQVPNRLSETVRNTAVDLMLFSELLREVRSWVKRSPALPIEELPVLWNRAKDALRRYPTESAEVEHRLNRAVNDLIHYWSMIALRLPEGSGHAADILTMLTSRDPSTPIVLYPEYYTSTRTTNWAKQIWNVIHRCTDSGVDIREVSPRNITRPQWHSVAKNKLVSLRWNTSQDTDNLKFLTLFWRNVKADSLITVKDPVGRLINFNFPLTPAHLKISTSALCLLNKTWNARPVYGGSARLQITDVTSENLKQIGLPHKSDLTLRPILLDLRDPEGRAVPRSSLPAAEDPWWEELKQKGIQLESSPIG